MQSERRFGLMDGMEGYVPIAWRVCRALDNPVRLAMLRVVLTSRRPMTVGDICDRVAEKESVTSQYLRLLNAQGFIVATRRGRNVLYERRKDADRALARVIDELEAMFARGGHGWMDAVLETLPGFSNARKICILSTLRNHGSLKIDTLAERTCMPVKTCYRIVGELSGRGLVVWSDGAECVILRAPAKGLSLALYELATG